MIDPPKCGRVCQIITSDHVAGKTGFTDHRTHTVDLLNSEKIAPHTTWCSPVGRWRDPGGDAIHPRSRWPAREPTASVPCPSRTHGTPQSRPVPLPDPWRTALCRRPGYPSNDRLHQGEGVEVRIDLLAEDRNLPGGFDAQAHVTI